MKKSNKSVAILGGGISGLSIAYHLKKSGFNVTIYEKNEKPGGVIQSQRKSGWLVEEGPNTILVQDKKLWHFFVELNLTNQIEEAGKNAKKRFIVRDKILQPVPSSLSGFLTTNLLSTSAKFKLFKEPFIAPSKKKDETIADFMRRRLGNDALDYGMNPFVAGVYAGDPKKLSVKHTFSKLHEVEQKYGSVLKGMLKKKKNKKTKKALISFDEGLQVLPVRLHQKLENEFQVKTEVSQLSKKGNNWLVSVKRNGNFSQNEYGAVVSTLPAYYLSNVWSAKSKDAVNKLAAIGYAPISVVALGFKKGQIDHPLDGFGMLIPEKENFNILGCLFSSSLFPNRAPEGHVLLTCFLGGMRQPALANLPAEKLIAKTLSDLDKLLGVEGKPDFKHHSFWQKGIPQFNLGYNSFPEAADQIEKENDGFFISGNFISGVSIPDCILASFEMVKRVEAFMNA